MNGYGESEKYGNGLLDIAYALDRYDYFKQQYDAEGEETAAVLEENDKEVLRFEEIGLALKKYTASNHPNGTYAEFSPVKYENKKMENYKLGNIQRYVEDVSDTASARSFSLCNHNISGT